jgi:hypothetical protein
VVGHHHHGKLRNTHHRALADLPGSAVALVAGRAGMGSMYFSASFTLQVTSPLTTMVAFDAAAHQ